MKKVLLISVLSLMLSSSLPIFAANQEIDQDETGPVETVVTYGVDSGYTVMIPADFTLTGTNAVEQTVSAKDVCIPSGTKLQVSMESDNYSSPNWNLVDEDDSSNKIAYTISGSNGDIASGSVVLEVTAGTTDGGSEELSFKINSPATKAGTYKDTLSFTIEVK